MNKNSIIGFVLIFAIMMGFSWYQSKQYNKQLEAQAQLDSIARVEQMAAMALDSMYRAEGVAETTGVKVQNMPVYKDSMLTEARFAEAQVYKLSNDKMEVEFTTKGTVFLARQMDLMFIEWKQGEIEELYHVYKNGAEGLFGNYVLPHDQDTNHASFLTFINTSSGFVKGKMVNRFYNLDKIKEVCDRYGWDFNEYKELAEKNRDIFEKRAQNALLEYF